MNFSPTLAANATAAVERNNQDVRDKVEKLVKEYKEACINSQCADQFKAAEWDAIAKTRRWKVQQVADGKQVLGLVGKDAVNPYECKGK